MLFTPLAGVHELVEAQAAHTPDAVAAELHDERVSYRDVNARANRLAHHLRALGVGPDVRVGIAMGRTIEAVCAILAVLKAGGAYVPLDPAYPAERLAFMLEDAEVRVLLTERARVPIFPAVRATVVCLDDDEGVVAAQPSVSLPGVVTADDLAYVIYTSGSTGRSKGVAMPHGPLRNLIAWQLQSHAFPGPARTLHFASMSFDVSFQEIFSTWSSGGTLVIAPEEVRRDPPALARLLVRREIERAYLPPVVLRHLAEAIDRGGPVPARLREIIAAGEALQVTAPIAALLARLDGCVLQNHYGPTETHVVTAFTVPAPVVVGSPCIGRPISNTRIHLLGADLAPVPLGEPGELYVGGAALARGYLGRPELTAERFVTDPSGTRGRLYRTGDRCRWQEDGTLEFLGRVDHQVKIRGFRIELGEIEAALSTHPEVAHTVAVAREEAPGERRLVAYLVARNPASPPAAVDLRRHLAATLPDPMIPAVFVVLDALPLLPNGKLDRAALPAPEPARPRAEARPSTPVEEVLAGLWADVLRLDRVGVDDDFFALGGHSLHATQVVARLTQAFGVELPQRALFEARTVALLAERIEAARARGDRPAAPPLVPRARARTLPLSYAQQQIWLLERLEPGSATYNIPVTARLEGPLDAGALGRSLAEIVRRHEALRTTFAMVDDEPRQVIEAPSFTMPTVDLGALPEATREAEVRRLVAEDARRPFDLARGPLFRATLLRLGAGLHVLSMGMHHVVSDGWSLGILGGELAALYEAFSAGRPSPLPELPVQLADVALWQRHWLSGAVLEGQVAYWKEQLRGAPPALDLPTDRPRPAVPSHRGGTHVFLLSKELAAALAALSKREGVTLFMTLLAAFQVLLHRTSGQDDIVVGSPLAGRTRIETEGLIGFLVNTLPLRTRLGGEPTFRELLARVREVTLGAYAHQDVPFEHLVEALAPARDPGRSPVFQVMLALQNAPALPPSFGALSVQWREVPTGTAKLDLVLSLEETARGIEGALEYATDLFDAGTIARMAGHLVTLLQGIVEAPERRLHALPLLSVEERRALATWNATTTEYPRDTSIQGVFEAQARRTPDAVAVSCGAASLTYRELDRRAGRLARRLRRRGVGSETPVGLLLTRSVEMVIAILAVLKAGGAYVPLDPEQPVARLAWMLEDAHVPLVLSFGPLPEGLPEAIEGLRVDLALGADASDGDDDGDDDALPAPVRGDSLAYVMYTSGSSGRPKGVCVLHRGVVRLVKHTSYARLGADEVFLQLAPPAFDASTFEIWGALLNGGRLVVLPGEKPSLDALADVLRRERVTTLWLTAGLFNAVMEDRPQALGSLRQLLVGGEALSVYHVQRALAELPGVTLVNGYGPTEGTTFTCCFPVTAADGLAAIPIGRPIANTTAHVLDRHLSPVPVGVPGELYAGGDGVARGYLNQPELTALRFVPDPFSADPGARMYRTGDLVRRLEDGTLQFLGRTDDQVKIRGHRIEPGEIEAALAAHPSVRASVVTAREDTPGDKRLCAYVVLGGEGAAIAALREHLAATLPDYMVPAAFVTLAALPLTPNGKVDRRALPAPVAPPVDTRASAAPHTPAEVLLAGIWAEVLRLDRVGLHDDFFALGGHSLLGTRVVARIGPAFGVDLPLRALFEDPTVARLAARIDAARRAGPPGARPPAPEATHTPRDVELPLSSAQERMWFLDQLEPGSGAYNMPGAVRLTGLLDVPALARSLEEITRRHEALRTTFPAARGRPRQVIAAAPSLPLPLTDLEALSPAAREAEVRRRIAVDGDAPFDLACGPLVRAALLRLSEREHVLLLTMHHIVGDGWSLGVLMRETGALYAAFHAGLPSPLPEPLQYVDHTLWQRRWLTGEVLEAQLSYWTAQLGGAPAVLDLPTDRPRPARRTDRGATLRTRLSREVLAALEASSRREGVTLFMTLLAALQTLLHLHAGQDDILVGSPIAGRTRVETEDIVGFFANTLVLRTDLADDPTFRELLGRVREVTLGAYDHQDLPFERVVEALRVPRDLGHNPLFQVMLVLQNTPASELALGGLTLAREPVEMATTRFDLLFTMETRGEELVLDLTYSTDLFDRATALRMAADLETLLQRLAADPTQHVSAARAWISRPTLDLAVVATFTAEPIEEALAMWTRELGLGGRVRFGPYGQVFQELLDPTSLLARNRDGANVVLVRFEDWMKAGRDDLEQSLGDLVQALKGASLRCPAPHVVVTCPPSPAALARPDLAARLRRLERSLASALAGTSGVHVLTSADIAERYPVSHLHDPYSDSEGHIPYTPLYFAALATAVVRRLSAVLGAPYKVVVLDCDQTLWKGVVGEVGPAGVELDPPRRRLQELMVEQHRQGMLLCLCSKNNEADVLEVFERRPEMPLGREHLLAHRINWRPKSENLASLAEELGLGLDSFVFVDDDPLEQAEVRARCPEVTTVLLPDDPARIPEALRHVWAFDHVGRSHEDAQRTLLYRQNAQRERLRREVPTLHAFVGGLELHVDTTAMAPEHLARVAQLTQRTNQLNFTSVRRTEAELRERLSAGALLGLVTAVRDRFGDYGLVGCVLFAVATDALRVDTFLLSCRALGRGVEIRMLRGLGAIARERGLARVEVRYHRSKKNKPALDLLDKVGRAFTRRTDEGALFDFPASHLEQLDVAAHLSADAEPPPSAEPLPAEPSASRRAFVVPDHVPLSLDTPEKVLEKARARRRRHGDAVADHVPPRTPVEVLVAGIWAEALGVDEVGVHDDFFQLGGHSLLATQVLSLIAASSGVALPLRALFEAPTVAGASERIEAARRAGELPAEPIPRAPRGGALPLSFAQQRLWLLDQLEPSTAAYNIPLAVRLDGALDAAALERSLAEIVRRHEALRTTFVSAGGEPRQVIAEPSFSLPVIALSALPAAAREHAARARADEEATRPFDLSRGPLFRAALLQLDASVHVLLMTMHHAVSDGWSVGVLCRELSTLYEAFSAGRPSPLAELRIQGVDHAVWQRRSLSGEALAEQLAYWGTQLRGAPPFLELPSVRPRPPVQTYRGAAREARLSSALVTALQALSHREGVTLFMTLLAAFQAVLHRYSGQPDVVVGSPIAGRTLAETGGLIGFFVNTLVLRTDLGGDPSFRALLSRVREVTLGAYAHQDMPFEKLVEELAPPRDLGRTPLFQVFFNMLNLPPMAVDLPGLSATPWERPEDVAKFDLNLYAIEQGGELALSLVYNTDLFDALQAGAMLDHLGELLHAVAADPLVQVSRIPLSLPAALVVPAETLKGCPGPRFEPFAEEATAQSIGQRFTEQARRRGAAVAIRTGAGELSYAALHAAVARVAAALGPRPGRVALLFTAGPSMVAAILGALAAGAVYVPLDLASPPERLAAMLEDAGASAILTHASCLAQARALALGGLRVVDVDDLQAAPEPPVPLPAVRPDDEAYILYTSGSTGRPKGVVQSHRNVLGHVRNYTNRLFIDETDALALVASYTSDAAVQDIFGALLNGAAVCPIDLRDDGLLRLPALLRSLGVTVYHATPTVYRHLVSSLGEAEVLPGIRRVVLGGERVRRADVDAFRQHFRPDCVFVNGFGLTESTMALHYQMDRETIVAREDVPAGYPVDGARISLLNAAGEQVAVYGTGEIVLHGRQVALGYWQPGERAVAAFPMEPGGGRTFHTGDLARRLPGGALEIVGRRDHQVKIRGYRVELGEIERTLSRHPAVEQAVVVAVPGDDLAGPRLLAHLVAPRARGEARPPADELVRFLRAKLPEHMIPAAFLWREAMPLLATGKIDRMALPASSLEPIEPGGHARAFTAPRTPAERALAGIWADLLGIDRVGVDDDFFALGGHSLLAVKVFARVEERFGKRLPLATLFQAPTLGRLAALLAPDASSPSWSSLIPIATTGARRPFFCVHAFGGNVLNLRALARHIGADQPFYGLQSRGLGGGEAPHARVEEMAADYLDEIRAVQPRGPYALGGSSAGGVIAYEMAQQLHAQGERVAALVLFDTRRVDAASPRLTRALSASPLHPLGVLLDRHLGALLLRRPRAGLAYLAERVRARFGDAPQPLEEAVRLAAPALLRVIEANHRALRSYTPEPYPGRAVMLLSADEPERAFYDSRLAWADLVEGGLVVRFVPGSHDNMLEEPQVSGVAAALARCLRETEP